MSSSRCDDQVLSVFSPSSLPEVLIAACSSDAWLQESDPSANHLFDPRLAREITSFWYVSASQFDVTAELLKTRAFVSISPERAAPLIGRAADIAAGESLYLIRAVDDADPTPLSHLSGGRVGGSQRRDLFNLFHLSPADKTPTRRCGTSPRADPATVELLLRCVTFPRRLTARNDKNVQARLCFMCRKTAAGK